MEKFTFFWNGPFSQWYSSRFDLGTSFFTPKFFTCAEQAMMYSKAILFKDYTTAKSIMKTHDPSVQKKLGRGVLNFDPATWDQHKYKLVYQANYAKFTQNPSLLRALLDTKGTTLVEASPYDRIWGIGLSEVDPRALDRSQWRGENLLGKILTDLRENLIKEGHQ
jgi:ribA/ribD-fused uncharacterized protein